MEQAVLVEEVPLVDFLGFGVFFWGFKHNFTNNKFT